jgi:LmbE family N-acetylglucosaminyl deacetylase
MKPILTVLVALCLSATLSAQTTFTDPANLRGERVTPRDGRELPIDGGPGEDGKPNAALGLQQLLHKLNTRASILNIVAHPDDEDGGMLTYYSRGLGARVADLSLTRGEGGQNAMTGDFEDALGLLRTQELLANDRYTGVDQMFGTEVDFGFSKTKSEAFAKWTRERVLYDAVRAVRLYRPLVIVSTWTGNVTDGHGQHQVAGEIAQEVFNKAGDPKVFPEMIAEGILPWQPLKVYARVPQASITPQGLFDYATGQYTPAKFTNYVTGEVTTTPPSADVIVHEGTPDPLLTGADGKPLSYVQFARIGLGQQKSQIPAGFRMPQPGKVDVPYHLYGSRLCSSSTTKAVILSGASRPYRDAESKDPCIPPAAAPHLATSGTDPEHASFFDGIDTSIEGIVTLAPSAKGNVAIVIKTNLAGIEHSIEEAQLDLRPGHPELAANRIAEALTLTDGAIANIDGFTATQLPLVEKSDLLHELRIKCVQLNDALTLALGLQLRALVTPTTDASKTPDDLVHPAPLASLPGAPNLVPGQTADIDSELTGNVSAVEQVRSTIQLNGKTVLCDGCGDVLPREGAPLTARVHDSFTTRRDAPITRPYFTRASIEQPAYNLLDPALRNAAQTPAPITVTRELRYQGTPFFLSAIVESNATPDDRYRAGQPVSIVPPPTSSELFRAVGYGDLPRTNYFPRPKPELHNVDLKLPSARRIAYLPGTGDSVPEALASIGLKPEMLTVADLTATKLANFDTVVLGVRTYAAHPDLHGAPTQVLLDYARSGGNVVVQYQTGEFTGDDAPYPLTLGRDAEKVVDETDAVQLLDNASALLTTPNRITSADFNGWIEERGHGFLHTWDAHYTALTETHDPGAPSEGVRPQEPQRGGLVTTELGKGRWTYVAFALYRQLPEAVPGAYRIFVNLLSK